MPAVTAHASDEPPYTQTDSSAEPRRFRELTGYQKLLFALLIWATFFEGFDTKISSLVLPMLGREFGVGPDVLGNLLATLGLGTILAVVALRIADRVGRRPMFITALGGYAVFTLATAFAQNLWQFAAFQFVARLLMVIELALAYVILSEEFPASLRGRANSLLGAFASVGAAVPAAFLPALEDAGLGWRGLFLLGAIPVILLPLYGKWLREPALFVERAAVAAPVSLATEFRALLRVLGPSRRRRFAALSVLWFTVNFWSACALFFFTLYAFEERGWTSERLQWLVPLAVPFGFAGYWAAGRLMDFAGRRFAVTLYLALGSLAAAVCYQSESHGVISAAYVALMMLNGLWPIANTISVELFPTDIRASATGFSHHLIGRWGMVVGPIAVGALAVSLGSTGDAVTLLSFANVLCIPVVWLGLPETRGLDLSEREAS